MQINDQNYVDKAESVIQKLKDKKNTQGRSIPVVTTSKLRNLLAMTADLYNEVVNQPEDGLNEDICSRIEYLRVRFLYEAGREPSVKHLIQEADLLAVLKEINGSKQNYILFRRYMEALIAFRKFYVEKDD